jgi:hypothetical protein
LEWRLPRGGASIRPGGFGNITSTTDGIGIDGKKEISGVNTGAPAFIAQRDTNNVGNAWQTLIRSGATQGAASLNGTYSPVTLNSAQIQAIEPQTNAPNSSDTQTYQLAHWTA